VFNDSSRKGTFLNGVRVGPQGRKLRRNDVIQCGKLALRVMDSKPQLIRTSTNVVQVQAVTHRSWEKALQRLANPPEPPREQCQHLLTLFRTGYHLCRVDCPDELMQTLLNDAVSVLDAQRGSIILFDDLSGKLHLSKAAQCHTVSRFRKWYSRTLAHRCFERGESFLCQDVGSELEADTAHSTLRQSMSSIICALLRTPRKKLGVLHLDRGPWQAPFTLGDFSLATHRRQRFGRHRVRTAAGATTQSVPTDSHRSGSGRRNPRSVYRQPYPARHRLCHAARPRAAPVAGGAQTSSASARRSMTSARSASRTPSYRSRGN